MVVKADRIPVLRELIVWEGSSEVRMHCAQGDINTVKEAQRGVPTQNWDGGGWAGKDFRCRMIKGGKLIMKREFSKEGGQKV